MAATAVIAAEILKKVFAKGPPSKKAGKKGKPKPSTTRRRANKRKGGISSDMNTANSRSYNVFVPSSTGLVTKTVSKRNHIVSVPFNSLSLASVASSAGGSAGFLYGGAAIAGAFDLNPIGNYNAGFQNAPFGIGIANVAKAYARYRMRSLRVTYVPVLGTGATGSVIIGATSEDVINITPTAQQVADCAASMTTPVWETATMDLSPALNVRSNKEWFYTYATASNAAAEQRQNYCCTLLPAGIGLAGATYTVQGYLRFEGVIEFTCLSDVVGGFAAPPFPSPSSGSPDTPLHVEVEEPTTCACAQKCPVSQQAPDCKRGWLG